MSHGARSYGFMEMFILCFLVYKEGRIKKFDVLEEKWIKQDNEQFRGNDI